LTNFGPGEPLRGDQKPRIWSVPPWTASEGDDAVNLAALAGLKLDPWQQFALREALGRRDGKWAAFEVCVIVARQNGKGAILEALELAALFLMDRTKLILHSAHEFKTCAEHFRRILGLIQSSPDFDREVARVRTQTGAESIELKDGTRLRFVARSSGSGRGFSGDLIVLDEAQKLGDEAMAALLPTLSARPDPQVWYTASAGDETSVQLGRVRQRGMAGNDPSLAFFEWSAEDNDNPADPVTWAKANPGLGIRITEDYIRRERAALAAETFAAERLTIGRYPTDLADAWQIIPKTAWQALADPQSEPEMPVAFSCVFSGDQQHAAIGLAGLRPDGRLHVEVAAYREGTAWALPWLLERCEKYDPCAVVVDGTGHERALIPVLEAARVPLIQAQARDVVAAFGVFREAVLDSRDLRHRSQADLDAALAGAVTRDVGDSGQAWGRRKSAADISPLVAVTNAAWGLRAKTAEGGGDPGAWLI
jgi:Phage Terminase